ncbi:hypothetical protein MHTCC0001_29010 [Flavobacteriaceae bacterium MHTCC 0001]
MQKISIIIILLIFSISSCSLGNDGTVTTFQAEQTHVFEWHLTNISGGIKGLNKNLEKNVIIWTFITLDTITGNGTLNVKNNNNDSSFEDGLESGEYAISIPKHGDHSFLFVDGNEFATLETPTPKHLILNQNIDSKGNNYSDRYIYSFELKVIDVN